MLTPRRWPTSSKTLRAACFGDFLVLETFGIYLHSDIHEYHGYLDVQTYMAFCNVHLICDLWLFCGTKKILRKHKAKKIVISLGAYGAETEKRVPCCLNELNILSLTSCLVSLAFWGNVGGDITWRDEIGSPFDTSSQTTTQTHQEIFQSADCTDLHLCQWGGKVRLGLRLYSQL